MLPFILTILLLEGVSVLGGPTLRISNVDEYIAFSKSVNTQTPDREGSTVFLDSDLDFTGKNVEPIGNSVTKFFYGVFNGQGHTISNLVINSTSPVSGLFGASLGSITIKNVVIDNTCSFTSTDGSAVGSILGICQTHDGSCILRNNVNMGRVLSVATSELPGAYVGGIAGYLGYPPSSSSGYRSFVNNCANYGGVNHNGPLQVIYIGGVLGYSYDTSIQNSLNTGEVIDFGNDAQVHIGGIVAYGVYSDIRFSIHAGGILTTSKADAGSIAGHLEYSSLTYTFWDDDYCHDAFGFGNKVELLGVKKFDVNPILNESISFISINTSSLPEAFSEYSEYFDYNGLNLAIFNPERKNVTFKINENKPFTLNCSAILLPGLVNEGRLCFDGWYTDKAYTTKLSVFNITENLELYGKWGENYNDYTITFDADGGSPAPKPVIAHYLSSFELPRDLVKGDCKVAYWMDQYGGILDWNFTVPARDVTLYPYWLCSRITSAEELFEFAKVMNTGVVDSTGLTVYLDSDIDLGKKSLNAINNFVGTFDGQGYVISNGPIGSSSKYAGLFGFSYTLSVQNVVFDKETSIMSTCTGCDQVYVGGIVGRCKSLYGPCHIKNSVNMGYTSFYRGSSPDLYLGGIAGLMEYDQYESLVRNCANYYDVLNYGSAQIFSIGGIVGGAYKTSVQNCLNVGPIHYGSSTQDDSSVGGIAGYGHSSVFENCLDIGSSIQKSESAIVGAIVGYDVYSVINVSFWVGGDGLSVCGYESETIIAGTTKSEADMDLVAKLNTYSVEYGLDGWLLNSVNAAVSFKISDGKGFSLNSTVILLPDPAESIAWAFNGWYENEGLTTKFTASEVTSDMSLYGGWSTNTYLVAFDFGNGTVDEKTYEYEATIVYPDNPERTGYTFGGWFEDAAFVTPFEGITATRDITLYAKWTIVQYTVTFNLGNGTTLNDVFDYGSTIVYPDNIERIGYTFGGWFEDAAFATLFEGTTATRDITLYAKWTIVQYTVAFDFGNGTVDEKTYEYEATIIYPDNVERTGYVFAGWFEDAAFATPFEGTTATRNVVVYAKYVAKQESEGNESGSISSSSSSSKHASFSFRVTPLLAIVSVMF